MCLILKSVSYINLLISMDNLQGCENLRCTKAYKHLSRRLSCKCFLISFSFRFLPRLPPQCLSAMDFPCDCWEWLNFLLGMWDLCGSESCRSVPPDIAEIILPALEKLLFFFFLCNNSAIKHWLLLFFLILFLFFQRLQCCLVCFQLLF